MPFGVITRPEFSGRRPGVFDPSGLSGAAVRRHLLTTDRFLAKQAFHSGCKYHVVDELHASVDRESLQAEPGGPAEYLLLARRLFGTNAARRPDGRELPSTSLLEIPPQMTGQGALEAGVMPAGRMNIDTRGPRGRATVATRTILLGQTPLLGQTFVAPLAPAKRALPLAGTAEVGGRSVDPAPFLCHMPVEHGSSHHGSLP